MAWTASSFCDPYSSWCVSGRQLLGGPRSVLRKSYAISTTRIRHRAGIVITAVEQLEVESRRCY